MFPIKKHIPDLTVASLALMGCGGEGLGEYEARLDRLEPEVTAFCMRAVDCVPRQYDNDVDYCRLTLLFYGAPFSPLDPEKCEEAWLEFFDCYAQADCFDFPVGRTDRCAGSIDPIERFCASIESMQPGEG